MSLNVGKELSALRRMPVAQLRTKYAEVFGDETRTGNKDWLVKRIIWRLQALAEGDLSERARQRALELANDADVRRGPPASPHPTPQSAARTMTTKLRVTCDSRLPIPGTTITRNYKGEMLQVQVLPTGFEYEGEMFKSLSAVAKKITGSHTNGYLFFNLTKNGGDR